MEIAPGEDDDGGGGESEDGGGLEEDPSSGGSSLEEEEDEDEPELLELSGSSESELDELLLKVDSSPFPGSDTERASPPEISLSSFSVC